MRRFVVDLFLASLAILAVLAFVFRSAEAKRTLILLRNVALVYIALVLALGLYRLWQVTF